MLEHYRKVSNVLFIALALNVLLALLKTACGILTGILAMIADGMHSFTDAASSVMGLIAIRYASQPSDQDHHYGHQKYETLAALGVGAFIGLTSWEVLKNAVERLIHKFSPEFHILGVWVMVFGILINIFVSWYEKKKADQYQSVILKADAYHTSTDIWVSLSVFISLFAIKAGFGWMDPIVSLGLVAYFLIVAYRLVRENILELSDAAFINKAEIKTIVLGVTGVISCHRIRTRGRHGNIFIDFHIQVAPTLSAKKSHEIVHTIENKLKEFFPGVRDILIHTEPYPDTDEDD